jgi:hypothetical protein
MREVEKLVVSRKGLIRGVADELRFVEGQIRQNKQHRRIGTVISFTVVENVLAKT